MKNAYCLFVGLLVVTMSAAVYADVVTVPDEGAGSIDAATIVAPMSPDTTVWVKNTFGNEIELYSGTTPSVPSGSQGLMIGGTENTAKIKVIANCLQNLGQTTVMNKGTLTVSGSDNTVDYLDTNLAISGGSVLVKKNYYSLRNGGNITISDGSLEFLGRFRVGYDSAATFDQTGGSVKLNTISSGDNKYMSIGYKSGANGEYNMSGGTLTTPLELFIGHNSGTEGTLEMTGGTVNSSTGLRIGAAGAGTINLFGGEFIQSAGWTNIAYDAGSRGSMVVKGGTFTYSSNDLCVGRAGDGALTLESGAVNLGSKALVVSSKSGSTGNFTMSGGTLTANSIVLGEEAGSNGTATFTGVSQYFAGDVNVGSNGNGTLTLNAATITNNGAFYVANHTGATGSANLNSGSSVSTKGDINVGRSGTGTLTLDSSSIESTDGYLYVGTNAAGDGTVTLKNGAKVTVPKHTARIGVSGKGAVNVLSGSTLYTTTDSSANDIHLGYDASGDGTLTIDGGTVNSKNVYAGNNGTGKLEVKSGTLNTGKYHIYAGNNAGSTGTVNISGGTVNAGDLRIGENGTGEANITGGTVNLNYIMYAGLYNKGTINVSGYNTNITASDDLIVGYDTKSKGDSDNKGGKLVVNGGAITVKDDIFVANKANSTGVFEFNGGTLTGKDELRVGDGGDGLMNVNGGNLTVSGLSNIGYASGSTGKLTIKNGSVTLTNSGDSFRIGREGTGTVEVLDGGYLIVKNYRTDLGYYGAGKGTLTIDGGTAILNELRVGYVKDTSNGRSTNYFNMLGGRLEITSTEINVGYNATGYAVVSGGEINFTSLRVGRDSGSYGELTIEGDGVMNMSSAARICAYAGSKGHVFIKGNGQMNVTKELTIGSADVGTVDVSGGQLNAYPINLNNGSLSVSGGVVRSNQVLVKDGTKMTVSGGQVNGGLIALNGSSDMTLSDNGVINVGDVTVNTDARAYLNGGTLNVGSLNNIGTTTLDGTTINLGFGGVINSTGTFDVRYGSVIVNPGSYYSENDQVLIGRFTDYGTANSIKNITTVPEGWSTAAIEVEVNGSAIVVAQRGTEPPTDVKIWKGGEAKMSSSSSWSGNTSNNTGFVLGGTNKFKDFSGNLVLVDGTNTFSSDAPVPSGHLLVIDGGTTTYGSKDIEMNGTLIVNGGTFKPTKDKHIFISGTDSSPAYAEVNGGTFDASRRLIIGNKASSDALSDNPTTSAKFVINGGIAKTCTDGSGDLYICKGGSDTPGIVAELEINGGELQVFNTKTTYVGYDSQSIAKFTMTNGKFTTDGKVYLAYGSQSTGTLTMSGGNFTTGDKLYLANGGESTGTFDFSGGFLTTTSVDVGKGESSTGTLNISGGAFTASGTITIAAVDKSTGIVNVSGGKLKAKNIKVGRAGAGDAAQLNITGGIVEITNAMYGSDSSLSGNVSISGTGQLLLNSTYSDADYAGIRELNSLEIAGAGDGNGAMRFLESLDSSVPITLTDDATIGIRSGATFTQRAAINAVPKRSAEQPVLTVTGGGTLKMTESETGSLKNIALEGSQLQMAPGADTAHFGFASVDLSEGSSVIFPAGKTINIGTPDDTEAFTTSVTGKGTFVIDSTLYLDAYTTDKGTGMDKLDFSQFNFTEGELLLADPLNLTVHLADAADFLGQVVTLDWLVGVPDELYSIDNINLNLVNDDGVFFYAWLNADGTLTFGDRNAIPEPSTWALLILGAAGLLYFRKRK